MASPPNHRQEEEEDQQAPGREETHKPANRFDTGFAAFQALHGSAAYTDVVKFDTQRRSWATKEGNIALRGVRRVLEERLWSNYDYKKAERSMPTPRARRVVTGVRSARGGRNRGSAVHEQLSAVAAMGWKTAQQFYAARKVEMEPLAVVFLKWAASKDWKLVGADVPVYDERPELRVGSAIDLVCARRTDGALIFIELKVGADNYWYKGSGVMMRELRDYEVDNSPLEQAKIQLLAYRALFTRCYGSIVPAKFIAAWGVVFVGHSGTKFVPITQREVQLMQQSVIRCFLNSEAEAKARARASKSAEAQKNKRKR